jgi:hypothetical protein
VAGQGCLLPRSDEGAEVPPPRTPARRGHPVGPERSSQAERGAVVHNRRCFTCASPEKSACHTLPVVLYVPSPLGFRDVNLTMYVM